MLLNVFVSAGWLAWLYGAITQEYPRSLTLAIVLVLIGVLLK